MTTLQFPRLCECGKYFTSSKQFDDHKGGRHHEKWAKKQNLGTTCKPTGEDDVKIGIHETEVTTVSGDVSKSEVTTVSGDVSKSTDKNGNMFLGIQDSLKIIESLRNDGVSIPNEIQHVIKVGPHSKFNRKNYEENLLQMSQVSNSSIFYKNGKVLGIVLFNNLEEKMCEESYKTLNTIYKNGGTVARGKTMGGADMVLTGWRYINETDDFGEYIHPGRSAALTNEFPPGLLSEMGADWTSMVSKILQSNFSSWMNELEVLHPNTIPDFWCRVGCSPFSLLSITKNYYVIPHIDVTDTLHGFIIWFQSDNNTGRGGEFVFPEWNIYIKPQQGTILLFDSSKIYHYTRENFGFTQIGIALVLKEKVIKAACEKLRRQMGAPSVLVQQRKEEKEARKILEKGINNRKQKIVYNNTSESKRFKK